MRTEPSFVLLPLALTLVLAATAVAQRGGRGRPEEIQNRVSCHVVDVTVPVTPGEPLPELATIGFLQTAASQGQPAVLYIYDGAVDAPTRQQFERTLFGNDTMGLHLRCFHFGRIDLAQNDALRDRFKKTPLFLTFGKDGKQAAEVVMAGYKPSGNALVKALEKAGNPIYRPSLAAVVDRSAGLVRDLEQVLARRRLLEERLARASGDDAGSKQKRAELQKDLAQLDDEQREIEQQESELVRRQNLPALDPKAVRIGGREGGGRGGPPGAAGGGPTGGGPAGGGTAGGGGRPGRGG